MMVLDLLPASVHDHQAGIHAAAQRLLRDKLARQFVIEEVKVAGHVGWDAIVAPSVIEQAAKYRRSRSQVERARTHLLWRTNGPKSHFSLFGLISET
jgi:hypothetical protein